jgi:hypothetical protein
MPLQKLTDCLGKSAFPPNVRNAIKREARVLARGGASDADASMQAVQKFADAVAADKAAVADALKPGAGESFSIRAVTPAQDAEYMRAVESGDTAKQQAMADEAAKASSPDIFDAREGIGQVPDNANIKYRGFVKWMTPKEFRSLVPKGVSGRGTKSYVADALKRGAKLGQPFIQAEWDTQKSQWKVIDHEGRSRVDAISEVFGDVPIPVHIFPKEGLRGRDMDTQKRSAGFVPQNGGTLVTISTSAEILRDASGKVIPLSERFNEKDSRITYSLSPHSALEQVEKAIGAHLAKNPEARVKMAEQVSANLDRLRERWKDVGEKRTTESLQNEQDMRQAMDRKAYEAAGVPATQARDMAAKNAAKWRKEADAKQAEDWQAAALTRDFQTYNALLAALPADIRGKMGGYVALSKIATPEAREKLLVKLVERGADKVEEHLKKEYREQITALVDKSGPSRESGEKPKGKLGGEGHRLVDAVAEALKLTPDQAQARTDELLTAMAAPDPDPEAHADLADELNLVIRFGGLTEQSAADLARNFKWLKDNVDLARSQWRMQEEARLAEVARLKESGTASIGGADLADVTAAEGGKGGMTTARASVLSIPGAMRALFGKDAEVSKRWQRALRIANNNFLDDAAALEKEFNDMLRENYGAGTPGRRAFYDEMMEPVKHPGAFIVSGGAMKTARLPAETAQKILDGNAPGLAKAYSKTDLEAMRAALDENNARGKEADDKRKPLKEIAFQQPSGGKEKELEKINRAKAIQMSLAWAQEQGRRPMEAHGFTAETLAQIESFLTPGAKAFRSWFQQHYAGEWAQLNAVFEPMQGVALPQIPNYAPLAFKAEGKVDSGGLDPFSSPMMEAGGMGMGMLKNRVERHSAQPALNDAFSVFFKHMRQTSYFRHFAPTVREMRNVLGSVDVQNAIMTRHGENGKEVASKVLKILDAGGSIAKSAFGDKWINRIAQARSIASLSLNPATVLKNSAAFLNLAYRIPAGEFSKGLAKLVAGKLDMHALFNSPTIQRRLTAGAGPEMQMAMQGIKGMKPTRLASLMQKGLLPISFTDAYTTAGSAAIALDYYRREVRAEGEKTVEADIEKEALLRLEEALGDVAQPIGFLDKSIAELERTALARLIFMFQSEPRQKVALQLEAGSEGDKRMLLKGLALNAVVGVAMQAIAAMWRDMRDDDDDELFDPEHWKPRDFIIAAVLGPWTALPIFGAPVIEALATAFKGVTFDNSLASDANKAISAAKNAYRAVTEEKRDGTLKAKEPLEKVISSAEALAQSASVLLGHGEYGAASRVSGYFFDLMDNLIDDPEEEQAQRERAARRERREAREDAE